MDRPKDLLNRLECDYCRRSKNHGGECNKKDINKNDIGCLYFSMIQKEKTQITYVICSDRYKNIGYRETFVNRCTDLDDAIQIAKEEKRKYPNLHYEITKEIRKVVYTV